MMASEAGRLECLRRGHQILWGDRAPHLLQRDHPATVPMGLLTARDRAELLVQSGQAIWLDRHARLLGPLELGVVSPHGQKDRGELAGDSDRSFCEAFLLR